MLEERLEDVRGRIAEAAKRAGRKPDEITLVAVGKRHPADALITLYEAGHRDFGESRVQELEPKAAILPDDVRWHFVGALQRNKVRKLRPLAHLVHSFDRPELADAWTRDAPEPPAPPVLLQVNVGREPQKGGVLPEDAERAVAACAAAGVRVRGLMTLPPAVERAEDARPFFRELHALRDKLRDRYPEVTELSMGMSHDFEVAIEEGATLVRVGAGLFGPRPE